MLSEISNLRDELQSLMEVQQQIMHYGDESCLENSQNLIRNSNMNNNNDIHSSSQIIKTKEAENVKNYKNKSFDNKNEKSNFYLPTCETWYKRADMTNDGILSI